MASTKLVRKALRNRAVSRKRQSTIKRLTSKPVIKNVDIEQIKEEFANKKAAPAAKKEAPVKVEPKAEVKEVKKEAPKADKKEAAPKAEAKKAEPKAEGVEKEAKKPAAKKAPAKKAAPKAKKEAAPKAEKKEDKAE